MCLQINQYMTAIYAKNGNSFKASTLTPHAHYDPGVKYVTFDLRYYKPTVALYMYIITAAFFVQTRNGRQPLINVV